MKQYFVDILSNASRTLYVGVTNDLEHRLHQPRAKAISSFTSRYNVGRLVYFEVTSDVHAAIAREKQIKGWTRSRKLSLVQSANPRWTDLTDGLSSSSPAIYPATEPRR